MDRRRLCVVVALLAALAGARGQASQEDRQGGGQDGRPHGEGGGAHLRPLGEGVLHRWAEGGEGGVEGRRGEDEADREDGCALDEGGGEGQRIADDLVVYPSFR